MLEHSHVAQTPSKTVIILPRHRPSTRDKRPSPPPQNFPHKEASAAEVLVWLLQTSGSSLIVHLTQQLTEHLSDHHNFSDCEQNETAGQKKCLKLKKKKKLKKNEVKSLQIFWSLDLSANSGYIKTKANVSLARFVALIKTVKVSFSKLYN